MTTRNKDCRWVDNHLVEMIEGLLTPGQSGRMEEHLLRCSRCKDLALKLQTAWNLMEKTERIRVSPGFESSLFEKIKGLHAAPARNKRNKRVLKALRPAVTAAGFALAVLFGHQLGDYSKETPALSTREVALEASYQEYTSGDLTLFDDFSRNSAAGFLFTFNVSRQEDSP